MEEVEHLEHYKKGCVVVDKELHIYLDSLHPAGTLTDFVSTDEAVKRGDNIIRTTQPHFCSFRFDDYRLFVHLRGEQKELKAGISVGTKRIIKPIDNLERLLLGGEFFD